MSEKRKRGSISLETKFNIIKAVERDEKYADIMAKFDLKCKSNICRIVQKKEKIINAFHNYDGNRKSLKTAKYEDIEEDLKTYILAANDKQITINGTLLKQKAQELAKKYGIPSFQASNGWMSRFRKRHEHFLKEVNGESSSITPEISEDWNTTILPQIISGFEAKDVYNASEFGLLYRLQPNEDYSSIRTLCETGALSDERITILICANCDGSDKKNLLIVGNLNEEEVINQSQDGLVHMSVTYKYNDKSWMTGDIFKNWLRDWNTKLFEENRKILLFIEDSPAHPFLSLPNIKLVFWPKNNTITQPCDQGIIKYFRWSYKLNLIDRLNSVIDENLDSLNHKHAISMAQEAWTDLDVPTIKFCFQSCGFYDQNDCIEIPLPLKFTPSAKTLANWTNLKTRSGLTNADLNEYFNADSEIKGREDFEVSDFEESEMVIANHADAVWVTSTEAIDAVRTLQLYCSQNNIEADDYVNKLHDLIETIIANDC